jgi:hypothetical protein
MHLKSASLITLSIAGLLAGAPAMADTYTGCLTPGGTIVRVAPGDAPRGGICPKNHMEITLGGSGGSGGFSGWEIVQVTETLGFAGNQLQTVDADCPAGKKPLGGGGLAQNGVALVSGEIVLQTSAPFDDASGAGWEVSFYHTNSANNGLADLLTFAICATVD